MAKANGSVAGADEAPKSLLQAPRQVDFHLTGFGVFNSVTDNPTTHLMRELPEEMEARRRTQAECPEGTRDEEFEVKSCNVLEVSAEGGGRQLRELFRKACDEVGSIGGGGGDEDFVDHCPATTVFVHCGVNIGSKEFGLEIQGFNEATFGAPDERDYCPTMEPVDSDNPDTAHRRVTTVPVPAVLELLRRKGWGEEFVKESKDAGRFVCNYVYYTSLGICEKLSTFRQEPTPADGREDTSGGDSSGRQLHSLFIHVPPFSVISKEMQLALLVDCLSAMATALSGAVEGSSTESAEPSVPAGAMAATTPSAAEQSITEIPPRQNEASVLIEDSRDPSEFARPVLQGTVTSSTTSPTPSAQLDKKSIHTVSSIWGSAASPEGSPPSLASPDVNGGSLHGEDVREEGWGANSGLATAAGGSNGVGEADKDPGYVRENDGDERRLETTEDVTRKRLVEAGFDVLDVDAAMATTGSDRFEVNMQFLVDMAPLLPPGAPTEKDGLFLQELSKGPSMGRGCYDASGRPPQMGRIRTRSGGSPAGMGGVSPKWVRDVSPVATGSGTPSPTSVVRRGSATAATKGGHSGHDPSPGRKGLLSRIRRHRRGQSAASETTEDGGSGDLSSSNEYCRRTTGRSSNSPITPYANNGFTRRKELSAGWGDMLPGSPNLRLVLLVRLDVAMGPGAIASQCCKAALAATRKAESSGSGNALDVWREAGEAMVVLGVADVGTLDSVLAVSGVCRGGSREL